MNWIIWAATVQTAFAETGVEGRTTESKATFQIGKRPGTFLSVGALGGLGFTAQDGQRDAVSSVYAGLEATASRVNGSRSLGLTSDVAFDTTQGMVLTVGPKVGIWAVHVDGGMAVRVPLGEASNQGRYGVYTKGSLNLGLGSLYYRTLWANENFQTVHQVGLSLRVPQLLGYQPRTGSK